MRVDSVRLSFRQRQRPVKHAAPLCPVDAGFDPTMSGKSAGQRYAAARFCIICQAMDGAALNLIFDRIDAALARIDAIASRAPQGDNELAVRHEQLRAAAAQTLRQLDALITDHSR